MRWYQLCLTCLAGSLASAEHLPDDDLVLFQKKSVDIIGSFGSLDFAEDGVSDDVSQRLSACGDDGCESTVLGTDGDVIENKVEGTAKDRSVELPEDPTLLESKFNSRMLEVGSKLADESVVEGLKVVLAVMSVGRDAKYREVIRRTWMKHPQVCRAPAAATAEYSALVNATAGGSIGGGGCAIFTTFCLGTIHPGTQGGLSMEDAEALKIDGVILPMWENMNKGKTLLWFQYALEAYPWATHIGKMDQDAFPVPGVLLPRVAEASAAAGRRGCEVFLGEPVRNSERASGCRKNLVAAGEVPSYGAQACAFHMNGGLYIASRRLLAGVAAEGGFWEAHPDWGGEDCLTGVVMLEHARRTGACINVWGRRPRGAWEHWKSWDPPADLGKDDEVDSFCVRDGGHRIGLFEGNHSFAWPDVSKRRKGKWRIKGWGSMPEQHEAWKEVYLVHSRKPEASKKALLMS